MPWHIINSCINNDTFEYNAPQKAQDWFKKTTGLRWDNLDDPATTLIECANRSCAEQNPVPWTTCNVENGLQMGTGLADRDFRMMGAKCRLIMDHDSLVLGKFRDDIQALKKDYIPLPGTVLNVDAKSLS